MRFDRGWIVSREARNRFMLMSVLSVVLGVIFVLMTYLPAIFDGKRQPLFVRAVVLIVTVPAIIGGLCMFFGMEWYCLEVTLPENPSGYSKLSPCCVRHHSARSFTTS